MMFSLASFAFAETFNDFTVTSSSQNVAYNSATGQFDAYYTPNYKQASFTATPTDGTTTVALNWTTSNKAVVGLDSAGTNATQTDITTKTLYLLGTGTADITVDRTAVGPLVTAKTGTFKVNSVADTVQSVTIDQSSPVSVGYGQTATLSARVSYAHCPVETSATWTSADPTIASVSSTGVITGNKVGTTTITASSGGSTSSAVTVNVAPTAGISPDPADVDEGTTTALTMTASGLDSGMTYTYVWSSNNAAVPVTGSGSTAAVGTTDISDKQTATITCIVKSGETEVVRDTSVVNAYPRADSVAIYDGSTDISTKTVTMTSQTKQLTAVPAPSTAARGAATWNSDKTSVATVGSTTGLVTAVSGANGTAKSPVPIRIKTARGKRTISM